MKENFDKSLAIVLKHEGGFTNDKRDPGNSLPDGREGSTMLGVTQANWENYVGHAVTQDDMKKLTVESVKPFYKQRYWNTVYGDVLPTGLDYLLFDFAVNAGPNRAVKTLQTALGCVSDGVIGPNTMKAINDADAKTLIDKFTTAKTNFYKSLKTFPVFGKGWLRRVEESKQTALSMI